MQAALDKLGFGSCCHASDILFDAQAVQKWCDILDGKKPDWESIFEGYQSTVDWPSSAFYKEQMQAYPEARVILTLRSPDSWYRSVQETIYPLSYLMAPRWLCFFSKKTRNMRRLIFDVIWEGQFRGLFEDREAAIGIFTEHIETVKREVPPERLLVFDVRDGWEPLCALLGIDSIPDEPFPHVNESMQLKRIVRRLRWMWRIFYATVVAVLLWAIVGIVS